MLTTIKLYPGKIVGKHSIFIALATLFIQVVSPSPAIASTATDDSGIENVSQADFTPIKEVETGLGYEDVSGGLTAWQRYYIEGMYRFGRHKTLYGQILHTDRFNVTDQELVSGLYYPLGIRTTGVAEISYSPSHNALASKSLFGQLQVTLPDDWGLHIGHRIKQHPDTNINITSITLENYFSDYRGAYTLSKSSLSGTGLRTGHNLRFSRYYGDSNSIGIALASGREAEYIATSQTTIDFDTSAFTIIGRHWLHNNWAISYTFNLHEQGDSYTRRGVTLGLRKKY